MRTLLLCYCFVGGFVLTAALGWADVSIGTKAYAEKQYDVAFAEFTKSARQGDVVAMRNLAIMYFLGQGAVKDERQGMELSRQCAQAGDSACMVQAAESAILGRGTPVNLQEGREWARKALVKGDPRAGLYLAKAYLADPDNRFIVDGRSDHAKYEALAQRTIAQRAEQIEAIEALAGSAQAGFIPARLLLGTLLFEQSGGLPAERVALLLNGLKDVPPIYQNLLKNTQQVLALGPTHASPRLVADALKTALMGAMGQATRAGVKDLAGCKDFKPVKISQVTPLQDVEWLPLKHPLIANTYPLKGHWTEEWTVILCNAPYTVHMQFQADGLGGAYHNTRVQ
jgi:TPR repeat protein